MNHPRSLVWSLVSTTSEWTWEEHFCEALFVKMKTRPPREKHAAATLLCDVLSKSILQPYLHSNLNLRPKQEGSYNGKDCVAILRKGCEKSIIFPLLPPLLQDKFNREETPSIYVVVLTISPLSSLPKEQWRSLESCGFERQAKGKYWRFEA